MITFGIVASLILLALLISAQMYFYQNLFLKLVVVTYLFAIASLAYFSFDSYFGWPVHEKITRARVVAIEVVEPTAKTEGAIYLWVYNAKKESSFKDMLNYTGAGQPRAYAMEYEKEKGDKLLEAKKKMESGMLVFINTEIEDATIVDASDGVERVPLTTKNKGSDDSGSKRSYQNLEILNPTEIMKKE